LKKPKKFGLNKTKIQKKRGNLKSHRKEVRKKMGDKGTPHGPASAPKGPNRPAPSGSGKKGK